MPETTVCPEQLTNRAPPAHVKYGTFASIPGRCFSSSLLKLSFISCIPLTNPALSKATVCCHGSKNSGAVNQTATSVVRSGSTMKQCSSLESLIFLTSAPFQETNLALKPPFFNCVMMLCFDHYALPYCLRASSKAQFVL